MNCLLRTNMLDTRLFEQLKSRAASERVTLKQLLRSYVEQGLNSAPAASQVPRSAAALPRLEGPLAMASEQLSNASLFELLEP